MISQNYWDIEKLMALSIWCDFYLKRDFLFGIATLKHDFKKKKTPLEPSVILLLIGSLSVTLYLRAINL